MRDDPELGKVIARILSSSAGDRHDFDELLLVLADGEMRRIERELIERHGPIVQSGPFQGMVFAPTPGSSSARLLSTYEAELHPHLELLINEGFTNVLNIGCAHGYYAVGFARRLPRATVYAFDLDAHGRHLCGEIAKKNHVSKRVQVKDRFVGADFEKFSNCKTLVIMDVEGEEDELLNPEQYRELQRMSIIVECHEVYRPGVTTRLRERFANSHDIERVDPGPRPITLPDWLNQRPRLQQLLATWEQRGGLTPWLVMKPL